MNKTQLQKLEWQQVRIRPMARRFHQLTGQELPALDDRWLISSLDPKAGIFLNNTRTDHGLRIGYDHLREYMTDPSGQTKGFLLLKSQTYLQGNHMWLEPKPLG